jgi:hypothetical protein
MNHPMRAAAWSSGLEGLTRYSNLPAATLRSVSTNRFHRVLVVATATVLCLGAVLSACGGSGNSTSPTKVSEPRFNPSNSGAAQARGLLSVWLTPDV